MRNRHEKLTVAALSAGHFINDSYSNLLSPLLPLLIDKLGFSLSQAGFLGGAFVFSSSLMQPVYGYLGDRHIKRAFVIYGPMLTAISMSCIGLAPNMAWLIALLMLGGIGIASFHPQGAALVAQASGRRKGLGMSIFVTSGSLGYATGPTFVAALILLTGLEHSYLAAIPGLAVCAFLLWACPSGMSSIRPGPEHHEGSGIRDQWRPITLLSLLVVLRSAVQYGVSQFLPLYFTQQGYSIREASLILTLYLLAGGLGGFSGGHLADRFSGKRIISLSMLLGGPLLLGFILLPRGWDIISLTLSGLILLSTTPINVVMAQELSPHRTSTVSALMMGFSWGIGGILCLPATGFLADHYGLRSAFLLLTLLPLIGYFVSLGLPDTSARRSEAV
jgi:MFS transporter, FSR family, fosmidomycin resistance protein